MMVSSGDQLIKWQMPFQRYATELLYHEGLAQSEKLSLHRILYQSWFLKRKVAPGPVLPSCAFAWGASWGVSLHLHPYT